MSCGICAFAINGRQAIVTDPKRRQFLKAGLAFAGFAAGAPLRAQDAGGELAGEDGAPDHSVHARRQHRFPGTAAVRLARRATSASSSSSTTSRAPAATSASPRLARSAPDGYTLGWITVASHAINPTLYAKMPFDHIKDFAPVSMTGTFPNLLVVNNNLPVRTVPELIALAEERTRESTPSPRRGRAPRCTSRARCSR